MKFIKRLFAKKYTIDEINERLAPVHERNIIRMNALTEKHLAESEKMYEEFVKKSKEQRKIIEEKFKVTAVETMDTPADYAAMFERIKATLPAKFR